MKMLFLKLTGIVEADTDAGVAFLANMLATATANANAVMTPAGIKIWYSGHRFFKIPAADFARGISSLPPSGWLIAMLYYIEEYAPGKNYRMIMMGTYNMIYNPAAAGTWDLFENTDENKGQAQARLGSQISYFNGPNIENAEYWDAFWTAFYSETW